MTADVTVCIPTYKAADFVATCIESVLAQSYANIKVLIAVEPVDDGTEEVCRRYEADPRVTVKLNPERLGWVGNVNACLDLVDTPFICFAYHDDWLEPDFVAETRAALVADSGAIAAFGHVQQHGARTEIEYHEAYLGSPFERAVQMLARGSMSYTLKAMQRTDWIATGMRMPEVGPIGYRAEFPMMVAKAVLGRALIVDKVLYNKSYAEGTVSEEWHSSDAVTRSAYEAEVRVHLLTAIAEAALSAEERLMLSQVALAALPPTWDSFAFSQDVLDSYDLKTAAETAMAQAGVFTGTGAVPSPPAEADAYLAKQLVRRAARHLQASDPFGAMSYTRQALAKAPELNDARLARAAAQLQLSRIPPGQYLRDAMSAVRAVTEAEPSNSRAWWLRAQLARRLGNTDAARRFALRALRGWPGDSEPIKRFLAALDR